MKPIYASDFVRDFYDVNDELYKLNDVNSVILFYRKNDANGLMLKNLLDGFHKKGKLHTYKMDLDKPYNESIKDVLGDIESSTILYINKDGGVDMSFGPQSQSTIASFISDMK